MSVEQPERSEEAGPAPRADAGEASVGAENQLTNKEKRLLKKQEKAKQKAATESTDGMESRKTGAENDTAVSTAGDKKKRKREEETAVVEGPQGEEQQQEGDEEEAEPLSHKEQRKRRKLEKQLEKRQKSQQSDGQDLASGAEGAGAKERTKDGKDVPARSPFSVWIGNMSFRTSPQRIQEWLEEHEIEGVSRVHMPKGVKRGEYNKGFTYVDLPSEEMVQKAIKLSETNLDGRRLLIKSGSDFGGRPAINPDAAVLASAALNSKDGDATGAAGSAEALVTAAAGKTGLTKTAAKMLRAQKNSPAGTLFVGNLSFETTEENLREMLENAAQARFSKFSNDRASAGRARKGKKKQNSSAAQDQEGDEEMPEADSSDESESEPEQQDAEDPSLTSEQKRARGAGIRQIRVGTFEDAPTKCKGWAFIDFHTTAHATATLIDYPRCYRLLGRTLILQYASPDAVRRGAPRKERVGNAIDQERSKKKGRPGKAERKMAAAENVYGKSGAEARAQEQAQKAAEVEELAKSAPAPGTFDPDAPVPKKHKETQEERKARREASKPRREGKDGGETRPKPGAALAAAQRASQSILPSQGKKVVF